MKIQSDPNFTATSSDTQELLFDQNQKILSMKCRVQSTVETTNYAPGNKENTTPPKH